MRYYTWVPFLVTLNFLPCNATVWKAYQYSRLKCILIVFHLRQPLFSESNNRKHVCTACHR